MKLFIFLVLAAIFAVGSNAFAKAGPPLIMDDTDTPGANSWEIIFGVSSEITADSSQIQAPVMDFNYGLGERTELMYTLPWSIANQQKEGNSANGFDQSVAGIKYRILDKEKDKGFSMSLFPQYSFPGPGASKQITDGKSRQVFLPLEFEQTFGSFDLNEEVGFRKIFGAVDSDHEYGLGLGLTYALKDGFSLMGEIHDDLKSLSEQEVILNLGGSIDLAKKMSLLLSAGRTLKGDVERGTKYIAYAGLQVSI